MVYIVLRNILVQLDETQGSFRKRRQQGRIKVDPILPEASLAPQQRQRTHCNTGSSFPFSPSFSFSSQSVCPCYPELLSLRTGLENIWAAYLSLHCLYYMTGGLKNVKLFNSKKHNLFSGWIMSPELKNIRDYPFALGKLKPQRGRFYNGV